MALTITSYTPATGSAAGGTTVTITGTGLDTVDQVNLGNKAGTIVSQTATQLVFRTPSSDPAGGSLTLHLIDNDTNTEVAATTPFVAVALASSGEKLVPTLARKFKLEVDSSAAKDGTGYIPVRAINDLQPAIADTLVDDSDYEDDGWGSDFKTGLKWSLVAKVTRKIGINSSSLDPGQEVLMAAHDQFGSDGLVRVRWYDRNGGDEAYEGYANVGWAPDGGPNTALSTGTFTLSGSGKRNKIANPAA